MSAPVDSGESRAMQVRREVLGDEHVNRSLGDASPEAQEFQGFVADVCWALWARPGLARKERSILVLGMTAALGRMEEFALHLRGARRVGISEVELDEIVLQIVAYCGAPAGVAARRALVALRAEDAST